MAGAVLAPKRGLDLALENQSMRLDGTRGRGWAEVSEVVSERTTYSLGAN